eukprot:g4305.t1
MFMLFSTISIHYLLLVYSLVFSATVAERELFSTLSEASNVTTVVTSPPQKSHIDVPVLQARKLTGTCPLLPSACNKKVSVSSYSHMKNPLQQYAWKTTSVYFEIRNDFSTSYWKWGGAFVIEKQTAAIVGKSGMKTLRCRGNYRMFYITNNAKAYMSHLTFKDCRSSKGGAIMTTGSSTLTMSSCNIQNSRADRTGGALYLTTSSTVTLISCEIRSNTAATGGGIHLSGGTKLVIKNSAIISNTASDKGGAVFIQDSSTNVEITKTRITNNKAKSTKIMTQNCRQLDRNRCGYKLNEGSGNCPSSSDCESGLTCVRDVGVTFGLNSHWDICLKSNYDYSNCGYDRRNGKIGCPFGSGILLESGSLILQDSTIENNDIVSKTIPILVRSNNYRGSVLARNSYGLVTYVRECAWGVCHPTAKCIEDDHNMKCVCAANSQSTSQNPVALGGPCQCPAGYGIVNDDLTTCQPCAPGKYKASIGPSPCLSCGAISVYCPGTANKEPKIIPDGYVGAGNDGKKISSLEECEGGTVCVSGKRVKTCAFGEYAEPKSGQCKWCAPGRYGDKTGAKSESECKQCASGTYSFRGSTACTTCAPGRIINSVSSYTSANCGGDCGPGRYRDASSTTCKACEAGRYNDEPATGACKSCEAGYVNSDQGQTSCATKCSAGTYSLTGASTCIDCPVGKIRNKSDGYPSANCGGDCGPGRYRDASSTTCKACEAGRYNDEPATGACKSCEAGYVNSDQGQTSCATKCSAGTYSLTGASTCIDCPAGKNSHQIGLNSSDACVPVPAGKYADADRNEIGCPPGQYQDEEGQTFCKLCPAGYYNEKLGQSSCTMPCAAGKYSVEGARFCQTCPAGRFSQQIGLNSSDACIPVPRGKYASAAGNETNCQPGQYQDEEGQTFCKLCPAGYYSNEEGQTSCNTPCRVGTYSREGSTRCEKCPGGYKGIRVAATSLEDGCLKCEQGKFSNDTGGHQDCIECRELGTYCPSGAIKPELCGIDKFCDGKTMRDRPQKPTDVAVQSVPNRNAMNVTWKLDVNDTNEVDGTFRLLYTTKKDTPLADMDQILVDDNKEFRYLSISRKQYHAEIRNLRVGTQYFVRILRLEHEGNATPTESQPSELSDKVEMLCPDGAYCGPPGGSGVRVSNTVNLQGYFKINNLTFVECEVAANCPGVITDSYGESITKNRTKAGCPDGYRGLMCLKCQENYTRQGDTCNECGSKSTQVVWMIGALVGGVCLFSYLIYKTIKGEGNPKDVQSGIIKIALRQFQLIGIISQFPLSWSDSIKRMFGAFNTISNAGSQAFSVDCFTQTSYVANSVLNLSMPIGILAFFWIMISHIYKGNKEARTRNLKLSTIVILMTLHPTLVKQVLGFFQCTKLVIDKTYLIADVDIQCRSSTHFALVFMLGVPALIVYTLGIPVVAGMSLFMNRHNLRDSNIRKTFGFLYSNYEEKHYYWELVIILRLVAMAGVSVLFEGNPTMQATLGAQVLFLAMFLHMVCRPFEDDMLDTVETYSLASSVLSLTCGNLLLSKTTPEEWKSFATVIIFISMFAFTIYCIALSVYAIANQEKIMTRRVLRQCGKTVEIMSKLNSYPILKSLTKLVKEEWKWEYFVETDEYAISRLRPGTLEKSFVSMLSKKRNVACDARKIEFVVPMPLVNVWKNFITRDVDHKYFPNESNSSSKFAFLIINPPSSFISPRLLVFEEQAKLFDNEGMGISAASTTRQALNLAASEKKKDQVLMSMPIGGHIFERLDNENTKVTHLFSVDIGGSIPIQISNIVARREITKGHTVIKKMLKTGQKTYFQRKYFTVHASPVSGRSTFKFTSKESTNVARNDIEMTLNPTWSKLNPQRDNGSRKRADDVNKIAMKINPMNELTRREKYSKSDIRLKVQAKTKNTMSSNTDSRKGSSTDLIIGAEIGDKWDKYIDPESGDPYWHNKRTGETTWDEH